MSITNIIIQYIVNDFKQTKIEKIYFLMKFDEYHTNCIIVIMRFRQRVLQQKHLLEIVHEF